MGVFSTAPDYVLLRDNQLINKEVARE